MTRRLLAFFSVLFLASTTVPAQIANHVVISEVSPMKAGSTVFNSGEFIELYNPTSSDITFGANVQIVSGNTSGTNAAEWQLSLSGRTIKAYGFFLIGDGGIVPRDTAFPASKNLANSGIRSCVQLRDGTTVIDAFAWDPVLVPSLTSEGTRFTPSTTSSDGKSFERKSSVSSIGPDTFGNGYDTDNNATDFLENSSANANPQTSLSPVENPPTGADTTPPVLFTVKSLSSTTVEVAFNEPVDSLTSSNAANYTINKSISVSQAVRNSSPISKVTLTVSTMVNDVYSLTVQNVKDTAGNAITSPQNKSFSFGSLTMAQARGAGAGQTVRVSGIITVANQFGSPSYIQDSTGALAVFNATFSTSAKVGDIWEVAGTLKNFNGLLEFDPVTDSLRISSGNLPPVPKIVTPLQMNESLESQLVRVNKVKFVLPGNFGSNSADSSYTASDASGSVNIRIDKDSNIPGSAIPSDSVNVVGIVNDFNGSYRLMPRSVSDIGVVDPPPGQTWTDLVVARGFAVGTPVKVRGIATYNQPSATASKTIFIQDATAGIALFSPRSDTLLIGDSVEAKGVISQFNNLLELSLIDTLTLLGRGLQIPAAKPITVAQVSETYEAQLVKISGVQFVESGTFADGTSGATFHVTDGSKQLDVRIPKNSALTGTTIPVGAIEMTGVVGQFQTTYQFTPRSPADLVGLPGPQLAGAPVITSLSDDGFTLAWTTLLNGDTRIYFGATTGLGDSLVIPESTQGHLATVLGLKSGRIYYYRVGSTNESGSSYSSAAPLVTLSSASSGQMNVYFNYSVDNSLGLSPAANGNTDLKIKLLDRITAATKSIDFALYSFDDFTASAADVAGQVADSLIAAKNRGVKVRMVFENRQNTPAVNKLIAAGISVIKRPSTLSGLMHNKFLVFDGRDTTSATDDWVIMGSWNVTDGGTYNDSQNALFIQDQSLARIYTLEFEEMFGSQTETGNATAAKFGPQKQDNTPHVTFIGGKKVEVSFSPSDRTTSRIVAALSSANYNIFFGLFSFTRDDIGAALIERKNAGVIVRGMIDNTGDSGVELPGLQAAGVDVHAAGHSVVTGDFHHKYGVVDPYHDASDPIVITGSHNWSSAAENDNDENTLIIHSGAIARQFVQEFSKRYQESGGTGPVLSVELMHSQVPSEFALSQNYPNPFNPTTSFELRMAKFGFVSLKIYDVLGREVASLVDEQKSPGVFKVMWDASKLPSGIYVARLQTETFSQLQKLVLVK